MELVVRPAAAADIEAACVWYERQRAGLGDEFVTAVEQTLERVVDHPRLARAVHRDVRRARLRRFPYSVFYRVVSDHIVVIACFHASRNPRRWKLRK